MARDPRAKGRLGHGWFLAKFHGRYPGLYYRRGWPTRDGVIPHKLFTLLLRAIDGIEAGEQLRMAQSIAVGIALAIDGKSSKTKNAVRKITRRAFPEVSQ